MAVNFTSIGISGIYAAEAWIAAIESNIANASNPNYSAESVELAVQQGADGAGAGVDMLQTSRAEAPFLTPLIANTESNQTYNKHRLHGTSLEQEYLSPRSF